MLVWLLLGHRLKVLDLEGIGSFSLMHTRREREGGEREGKRERESTHEREQEGDIDPLF